jgi:hypothetical protein
MASIRDQISSLTVGDLQANQLSAVAGKVFMSANSTANQTVAQDLTSVWRAVHAPTYGQPIPNSASTITVVGDGDLLAPLDNQTALLSALSFTNGDPLTVATVDLDIDGAVIASFEVPAAGGVVPFIGLDGVPPFYIVAGQTLAASVSGAPAASITVKGAYCNASRSAHTNATC